MVLPDTGDKEQDIADHDGGDEPDPGAMDPREARRLALAAPPLAESKRLQDFGGINAKPHRPLAAPCCVFTMDMDAFALAR